MINQRKIYIFSVVRLVVIPITVFLVLHYILRIDSKWLIIIPVVTAGMPVATNTGMLAKNYKNNATLASQTILISTVLCMITIPIMVYLLNWVM